MLNLGGHIAMFLRNSAGANTGTISGPLIDDGVPHMFCLQYDTAALKYYFWLDAVQFATGTAPAPPYFNGSGGDYHFFSRLGGSVDQGYVGDAALFGWYNHLFNQSEQQLILFQAGIASFPPFIPPATVVPAGLPAAAPGGFTGTAIADVIAALNVIEAKLDNQLSYSGYQAAPSLAYGTAVTGLTGSGTIPAAGLLGVEVQFTTIPAGWGYDGGTPRRYTPPLGRISLEYLTGGPWASAFDVRANPQQILFDTHNVANVAYTFEPGVHVTLVPITRGP